MATKKYNESSRRYYYGFPGAEFPNLEAALQMTRYKYAKVVEEYGEEIKETYDQALVVEENSVYLQLTRVVEV